MKVIHDATIGKPMVSKQRLNYLTSNNLAHDDAFYEARVLHRDISVGNIVILEDGTGLLVDWDLCKVMDSASENEKRVVERTVSERRYYYHIDPSDFERQFVVACLLMSELNQSAHNREDNLESFLHVLNWMALRYTSHTLDSHMLTYDLQRIYDSSYKLPDGRAAGGRTKSDALLSGHSVKGARFQNLPLVRLLKQVGGYTISR